VTARSSHLLWAWLPVAAYMLLIWTLSAIPHQVDLGMLPFQDKGAHFLEYGALGCLFAHAVRGTWLRWHARLVFLVAVVGSSLWGVSDEIHQAFVPGRNSDPQDLIADAIGAFAGACAYLILRARWLQRRSSR
jgi:VanZ family protein